jgi:putative sigma-54 modulation protein
VEISYQYRNFDEGERRFEEHAGPRLEHLSQQFERIEAAQITVSAQRNWRTVDLTVQVHGALLRAEERNSDALSAFDKALTRMERQLTRLKERQREYGHESLRTLATGEGAVVLVAPEPEVETAPAEPVEGLRIVRTKAHSLKPMTPEEAALQMELLGHDFFVFVDGDSGTVGVVYRRRDGGYGLIEAESAE